MREAFGAWGDRLGREAFGLALLARGLRAAAGEAKDASDIARRLVTAWRRAPGRLLRWRLPARPERLAEHPGPSPALLAEAAAAFLAEVQALRDELSPGVRLELAPHAWTEDWEWLVSTLVGAGAEGVYLREGFEGEAGWGWPLRIGASEGLFDRLDDDPWNGALYRCSRPHEGRHRVHLLVLEHTLPVALSQLVADPAPPSAEALVVLGGLGGAGTQTPAMVRLAARRLDAAGVLVLDGPDESRPPPELVFALVEELSHALPLDVAAARAVSTSVPILAASRELIEESSLRRQMDHVVNRLQRIETATVRVPERARRDLALANGGDGGVRRFQAAEVGRAMEAALPHLAFAAESGDAMTMAALVDEAARDITEAEARQDRRNLQARVESAGGEPLSPKGPLPTGGHYRVGVRIAHELPTYGIGLSETFPAPPLRPDRQPHRLSVLFWDAVVSPEPQVQTLLLPPRGDSEFCYFAFRAPDGPVRLAARIAVYHRNRNLQTGVLRGSLGSDAAELSFTIDAAPFPRFSGLSDRQGVGASLIFNEDDTGTPRVWPFANGRAGQVDLSEVPPDLVDVDADADDMEAFKEAIGRDIAAITAQPDLYEGLDAPGTVDLLVKMARRGGNLMRMLKRFTTLGSELDNAPHIQVVCAKQKAFFPAEYLYQGEIPSKLTRYPPGIDPSAPANLLSRICRGDAADTADAVQKGVCCGAYAEDPTHTVCPLLFWSLSKVIERHPFEREHRGLPADFQLRASPPTERHHTLAPLARGLLAASDRANGRVNTTVDDLKNRMEAVLGHKPLHVPASWTAWEQSVATEKPTLLVLLPHHEKDGSSDYLQIGANDREDIIVDRYVQAPDAPTTHPVVLLIGCDTGDSKVSFEGFVPQFQIGGAAIIVTTIASVLGHQAGPVAATLVEEINRAAKRGGVPFGQIMLESRRKLLASGKPMVLGLTSYGDADWLIGQAP